MPEVTIKPPSKNKPGYLKRMRARMDVEQRLRLGDPNAVADMVKFIVENADEIITPPGVSAEDALYSLSEDDFYAAMAAFAGSSNDTVPPTNGG